VSPVWQYFRMDSSKAFAQCLKCLKKLKYSGNTSNFFGHLLTMHGINLRVSSPPTSSRASTPSSFQSTNSYEFEDRSSPSLAPSQMTLDESFENINSFRDSGIRSELFTNAIATWIAKDVLAANIVLGQGFIKMFQMISPRFKVPHPNTIKRRIECKFESARNLIITKLQDFAHVALTADGWTHQYTNNQYIGITVHGFNGQNLESFCIACRKIDEVHSAGNLCRIFESVIESWGIEREKVVACITDNAKNIVNAIELFIGSDKHAPCFAHSLNLVVKKAIKDSVELSSMIQSVKDIVTFFHHSPKATSLLNSLQDDPLKLIQDVPTRWNSTFLMIERFLQLKEPVSKALDQLDSDKDMIPNSSMKILAEIQVILAPFYDVTKRLSSASNPSISQVIPLSNLLRIALSKLTINSNEAKQLALRLEKEMDSRFKNIERVDLYNKSTVLDPRFKNIDFQSTSAAASTIKNIDDYLKSTPRSEYVNSIVESRAAPDINNILTYRRVVIRQSSSNLSLEFRNYLDTNISDFHIDPLLFWTNNFNRESELVKLALKYLIIPATSVPSERLFSKAGDILNKKRSSLSPKRVEQLLIMSCLSADIISSL